MRSTFWQSAVAAAAAIISNFSFIYLFYLNVHVMMYEFIWASSKQNIIKIEVKLKFWKHKCFHIFVLRRH